MIFFNIGGQLLTNIAGFVIPGYYSLEALFSVGKSDDTQWLTVRFFDGLCWSSADSLLVLGCFRLLDCFRELGQRGLLVPILLHIQVHLRSLARSPGHWVRFILSSLLNSTNRSSSGAQIVFRSFIQPVFARYFSGPGATAANLRSKVDTAGDKTL